MGIRGYFKEILRDSDGCYSSKRFLGFASFILLVIAFITDLYSDYKISEFVFDAISTIVMASLASTVGEKFAVAWTERGQKESTASYKGASDSYTFNQPPRQEPVGEG